MAQIKIVVSALVSALLPEAAAPLDISAIETIIKKYDVHMQVVCASCNEMRSFYDRAHFMTKE